MLKNGDTAQVAAQSAPVKLTWESESRREKSVLALIEHKRAISSDGVTVGGVETKILSFLIKYCAVLDKKKNVGKLEI